MTNHKKLLQDFNSFLEQTHIRKYCSEVCKGGCCREPDCFAKTSGDFNWCHQHLACTQFLCYEMKEYTIYNNEIRLHIRADLDTLNQNIMKSLNNLFNEDSQRYKSIYFIPHSLFNFEIKDSFPKFNDSEIKNIRDNIDRLIENKIEIR